MQQNMGGYRPAAQKEKLGGILVMLAIRLIAGAVLGTITGLSMVMQPLSGGYGALTMIAGFVCVPAVILLFMRKPAFTWSFLTMAALNAIGGIVIASHPAMRLASMFLPAQKIFLVLIIIMDVLFIIYLIRSKKVASVFGANLFRAAGAQYAPQQSRPNAQHYQPRPQRGPAAGYSQPAAQAAQPYQPPVEAVQQPAYAQSPQGQQAYAHQGYGQQNQAYAQAPQQYQPQQPYAQEYQKPRQMKRGAFVGLCIGISAAAVLVISLLMNNYYEEKYSSPSFGLDSLFGSDSLFDSGSDGGSSGLDGLFDSGGGGLDGLFGSADDSYEEEGAADLQGYVDDEISRDVENSLYDMLKPGRSTEISDLEIEATGYGLNILCYLPEDYYITNWEELNSDANEANRESVAEVFQDDIYEKTGLRDADIVFIYCDEDGYYMTEYAY